MWSELLEEASRVPWPGVGRPGGSIVWVCAVPASLPVLLPLLCPWAGDGLPLCPCHELGDGCNINDVICLVDLHAT